MGQPEERLLAQAGVRIAAGDLDQRRHSFVPRPLRQGEDRRLPDLQIAGVVVDDLREPGRGRLTGGLAEPEQGALPRQPGQRGVSGYLQKVRPYRGAVREDRR